jgi:hypothetical protein
MRLKLNGSASLFMISLQGCNEFHDGWLHGVFGLPCVPEILDDLANEGWRLGYQTAIETGDSAVMAIPPMLLLRQIIVTKADSDVQQ